MPYSPYIIRIAPERLSSEFFRILRVTGFSENESVQLADIFMNNSLDGVNSHGINRFPRFIKNTSEKLVIPGVVPVLTNKTGSLEQWDGQLGPGPLNALVASERAMSVSDETGIGLVALSGTNHWMRGGTYGWHAAKKGYIIVCWTNTCRNMPAWGATDPRIGNNPLVIGIPYGNEAIVLDFAMSQYSYGKLETYQNEGKRLPYPGGFNESGELTDDPGEILKSWRVLPTGYWKGSSLSLLLDILAAVLSGGRSTHQIESCTAEYNVSQVFIAINPRLLYNYQSIGNSIAMIIDDLHLSRSAENGAKVRYPGEQVLKLREENRRVGIPVNRTAWEKLLGL